MRRTLSELIEQKKSHWVTLFDPLFFAVRYLRQTIEFSGVSGCIMFISTLSTNCVDGAPGHEDYKGVRIDTKSAKNFSFVGIECHFV